MRTTRLTSKSDCDAAATINAIVTLQQRQTLRVPEVTCVMHCVRKNKKSSQKRVMRFRNAGKAESVDQKAVVGDAEPCLQLALFQ